MSNNNILPNIDLQNSREYYGAYHSRDFYKGTSFKMAGTWSTGIHYFNDEYIVDFIAYNGALLACRRSHLSNDSTRPILRYDDPIDPNRPTGVNSVLWEFILSGAPGASGDDGLVYIPKYDENTGLITWILSDNPSDINPIRVKGDTGKDGIDGNGIKSISKTSSSGNIDTYSILYTSGSVSSFTVTNGVDGQKGETGKSGKDGIGIRSIDKISSSGKVDTYTISFTDGSSTRFSVTNGTDGINGQKGETGRDGRDGKDGTSATIRIDSVETGAPGTEASVINVGTNLEAALKFIIPRGLQGVQGQKGNTGDTGPTGLIGPEGKRIKLYRDFEDDTIKWGYDGVPTSEWTVLCYMSYLRGISVDDVDITEDAHLKVTLSGGHYTYGIDEDGNPLLDDQGNIIYNRWVPDVIITKGKACATLTAGDVIMLDPIEEAKIENVGTIKDPKWDLYIPRGYTGEHSVHVGPEDPVTFKNTHLNDPRIQISYAHAEDMIWVDTSADAEFNHLNSVYHGYLEAGGQLSLINFKEAFSKLASGSISFRPVASFEELGEPTSEKQGIIWLIPIDNPDAPNNLFDEYVVVKPNPILDTYQWELWGSGRLSIDLSNYYTKKEVDDTTTELEGKIEKVTFTIWNEVDN